MKPVTLDTFQDRTALLPWLIAERVCNEPGFIDSATERTVRLYNVNPHWRRLMHRVTARETLEAFMRHWYESYSCKVPHVRT